jgi:hypothetical protein
MNALLLALILTTSQAPADFSGVWAADPPAEKAPGNMGSGWAPSITITQNASELAVEEAIFSRYDLQPPLRTVYLLDGSESRNTVMPGHVTQTRVSRTKWDGTALVITTNYPVVDPGSGKSSTAPMTQRLTLDGGGVLVIETSRPGVFGGNPTTTKTTYRKK